MRLLRTAVPAWPAVDGGLTLLLVSEMLCLSFLHTCACQLANVTTAYAL